MANLITKGLSRDAVEALSRQKGEPEWMLQKRLHAWDVYEKTPAPLGRRGDLGTRRTLANFKFQELNPFVPSSPLDGDGSLPALGSEIGFSQQLRRHAQQVERIS